MAGARRSARLLEWLLGAALLAVCALYVTAWVSDEWFAAVDSAIYLLTAKSLAVGEGYTYLGRPFFARPPGFSLLLSPFVGEPLDVRALNLLVNASAAGAVLAVTAVLRRLHGPLLGTLAGLVFALSAPAVGMLGKTFAEFPHMLLFYAGLWLLLPARDGARPRLGRALLGTASVAASLYFRSVGLLLLPCLLLSGLSRRDGRRWQGPLLAALLLAAILPWMLHGRRAAELAERPSTQLLMFDYPTAMLHVDPRDPDSPRVDLDGWIGRVGSNAVSLARYATYALTTLPFDDTSTELETPHLVVGALVVLALVATGVRRRSLADGYLLLYGLLLATYFTTVDRLVVPVFPLVLSGVVAVLAELLGRLGRLARQPALPLVLGGLLAALSLAAGAATVERHLQPDLRRHLQMREDRIVARWVRQHAPVDAVLLHERGPILSLLTGRTVYTDRNLPGPWPTGCPPVDLALFQTEVPEETERRVRAVAGEPTTVPFTALGRPGTLRIYDLRGVDR